MVYVWGKAFMLYPKTNHVCTYAWFIFGQSINALPKTKPCM